MELFQCSGFICFTEGTPENGIGKIWKSRANRQGSDNRAKCVQLGTKCNKKKRGTSLPITTSLSFAMSRWLVKLCSLQVLLRSLAYSHFKNSLLCASVSNHSRNMWDTSADWDITTTAFCIMQTLKSRNRHDESWYAWTAKQTVSAL